jgi:hypothetical protein
MSYLITVKLGLNDHGYNEFTAITNKSIDNLGPKQLLYYINIHGYMTYIEQILMVPCVEFLITAFD